MTCGGALHAGQRRFGYRKAFVALKVAGLLEDNLVFVARLVEHVVQALVTVDRRTGAGLALQVDDRRAVREHLEDQLALRLAALDIVGADMTEDARHRGHATVDGHDGDLGVDRLLKRRRHRVDIVRAQHDALHAFGERRLDVSGLLRRGHLTVALDRVEARARRLGLERLHHMDEEWKAEAGHRHQDQRFVVGEGGRRERHRHEARDYNSAGETHGLVLP